MAPEMLLGRKYDAKADLWSVGVIAYECLFGKAPYSSGSYKELYNRIQARAPIVVSSKDATLFEFKRKSCTCIECFRNAGERCNTWRRK